ncbi:MAG: signal recognition particle-docking protein FtsY [Candidatus Altiarchaeota archaeon]|nr:signal recognition particle-docking protein FtsY [Candidatus Altiarchaeota archaeon]
MFGKLKNLFRRTEEEVEVSIKTKIKKTVTGKARLGDDEIGNIAWNFQMSLMQSDVAMQVAERIANELKEKLKNREFSDPKKEIRGIFREILLDVLQSDKAVDFLDLIKKSERPVRIVFFGINGCGKTTTIAKVADFLLKNNLSVVLAAGDTFRAGAIEQLGKHAERLGVRMIKHQKGGDSAAVVFDAVKHASANGVDVVLADTSGRMQSNVDLMGEMEKIVRVNKPDLKIFVGDALTGNDAVEQAEKFNEKVGIDASILTKCDAAKGGSALSITYITKKPILFLGVGQTYGDIKPFNAGEFVDELT